MKLLLDTHAFLWLVEGNPGLSATARAALTDPLNQVFISVALVWELAIKINSGKLTLNDRLSTYVQTWVEAYHLELLPIRTEHALSVVDLPNHHRDPFDRMLLAQTQVEGMTLLSADAKLAPYNVSILW